MISSNSTHYFRLVHALAGRTHTVAALALFAAMLLGPAAVQAQEYNRALRSQDVVLERNGSDGGWMISGRVAMDVQTTQPRDLSFQLLVRVNGRPIDPVSPGAYGWVQRLIFGLGVPGGGGGGVSCVNFCTSNCQNGSCNYYQFSNIMCMCANNEAGANTYLPSRFAAPLPPLRPGDEVTIWVLPLAGSPALQEIRTDDDVLVMIVPPCTAPTITHQPISRGLCPTDSGLFTVDASGTTPAFRWQWQPGGVGTEFVNIPQGTINNADGQPCFIVEGVSTASVRITRILDEQYYKGINLRCAVQNTCGSAISNTARFEMLARPLISTQPQSTTSCASGEAEFSVADTSGNPTPSTGQWQWRTLGTADWVNMVDGLNTDPATGEPAFT
ncbi:MAG: hypothetical protein NTV94_05360, partial [Planctomycetota bacterium]|nr:hypothetical protein [Planctomycetota bacterium]